MSITARPLVILLHGLARQHGSMSKLGSYLHRAGWDTWARTYPSRQLPIVEAAAHVADWIAEAAGDRPLYAVTHSMGGIIARHLHDRRLNWQRIVMLAPPNNGSSIASAMQDNPLYRWFYGPAGRDLANPAAWPAPPAPFAVIAGTRQFALTNPTSWTLGRRFASGGRTGQPEPSDGTVAVRETKLAGMAAFAEVDAPHTWIMNDPRVQSMVEVFLRTGNWQ
ncbi:MAG: alpha/beta fold hydrolase [Kofleriaceae bacterium]|nr:alpha/beta fold hydrolase [Kofleriaceae bacterium]